MKITEKQQFIARIHFIIRDANFPPIPFECLRDMHTVSLSRFEDWAAMVVGGLMEQGYGRYGRKP